MTLGGAESAGQKKYFREAVLFNSKVYLQPISRYLVLDQCASYFMGFHVDHIK